MYVESDPFFRDVCFPPTHILCDEINLMIKQFWWTNGEKDNGLCSKKRDDMCKLK